MPTKKTKSKQPRVHAWMFWDRFSRERTGKLAGIRYLGHNLASVTIPGACSPREVVEAITSSASDPIPVASLCDELNAPILVRGSTKFGYVGDLLDKVASNYPDMRWWIAENGLNMAILAPETEQLAVFDECAGRLIRTYWPNGRLATDALTEICKALDDAGFPLKTHLQPAQWKMIAAYNQMHPRTAIKTFYQGTRNPRFVRCIRRRLYVTRYKFDRAHPSAA